MKAYELSLQITEEGKFDLPADLAAELPRGQGLRVIILVPDGADSQEGDAWDRLTTEQFLAGYSDADSIYDTI